MNIDPRSFYTAISRNDPMIIQQFLSIRKKTKYTFIPEDVIISN